jgi:hypothetical protein
MSLFFTQPHFWPKNEYQENSIHRHVAPGSTILFALDPAGLVPMRVRLHQLRRRTIQDARGINGMPVQASGNLRHYSRRQGSG